MNLEAELSNSEIVDLADSSPLLVPLAGFDLIEGIVRKEGLQLCDTFLVERPGPSRVVDVKEDLYLDFWRLRDEPGSIQAFASANGLLGLTMHFHAQADMAARVGEPMSLWREQLLLFQETMDLWRRVKPKSEDSPGPERADRVAWHLSKLGAPWPPPAESPYQVTPVVRGLRFPPPDDYGNDSISYARAAVVATVNRALHDRFTRTPCDVCEYRPFRYNDDQFNVAEAQLKHVGSDIALTVLSGTLIKTLWTQLACYVAGMRHTKRCAAPDCPLGGIIDVTSSPRKKARIYHHRCEWRLKKQRRKQRESERERGNLPSEGAIARIREIANQNGKKGGRPKKRA
jgi:hypothetical protein